MRIILTHKTFQEHDTEQIVVEGESYDALLAEARGLIPEGRIAAAIRVER